LTTICEFRGKLELRNFSLIEFSRVLDLFRDENADRETHMEQVGAQVAKEQEQITVDGAPNVLNQKRWLLVLYVPMPAPAVDGAPTVLNQKRWLLVLYVLMPAPALARMPTQR
jgi:F420-dependent methylenetetrahydromethanopterin dehydrogenase